MTSEKTLSSSISIFSGAARAQGLRVCGVANWQGSRIRAGAGRQRRLPVPQ